MSDDARRLQQADEVLKRFAGAFRAVQLYSPSHPLVVRAFEGLADALDRWHAYEFSVVIGLVGDEIIVGDIPLAKTSGLLADMQKRLRQAGVERIAIERGVSREEMSAFIVGAAQPDPSGRFEAAVSTSAAFPHIRVGKIRIQRKVESSGGGGATDTAAVRRAYGDAVARTEEFWERARLEDAPDPGVAQAIVDGLARAVAQNRTAVLALTALRHYDNYTFTHMVNVSILTMAQARSLGIEGAALRNMGLAGLMHDIGKIRTPLEILTKPEKLTDQEFAIMKRHPVEGAEILRGRHEFPPLAAVVAFEHHLRIDGSGYPEGVQRSSLNLATMLCSIADVYDAMRSQRKYQEAFATERILAVLQKNDGKQFDQHLVRRFAQLMGIYPTGNLVRLTTGDVAVVVRPHAPVPDRPCVRVVFGPDGRPLPEPYEIALWEETTHDGVPLAIMAPVDPAEYPVDALAMI
jgi:putative nucleotidyltransferase with HDIG domain